MLPVTTPSWKGLGLAQCLSTVMFRVASVHRLGYGLIQCSTHAIVDHMVHRYCCGWQLSMCGYVLYNETHTVHTSVNGST